MTDNQQAAREWLPNPCLAFGWGLCRYCAAGFPQARQCLPEKKRWKSAPPRPTQEMPGD